jgi:branched-chain amino acid aminotransferase
MTWYLDGYAPFTARRLCSDVFTLFGVQHSTDHMMLATFHPKTGWSAPEIKPYGPLTLDPACSCFQYSTSVFEGMKVTPPLCFVFPQTICNLCYRLTPDQTESRVCSGQRGTWNGWSPPQRESLFLSASAYQLCPAMQLSLTSHDQTFNADALLELIKLLVMIDSRWVPQSPGCSLYIRPTLIGTRPCKPFPPPPHSSSTHPHRVIALGVTASDEAMLYVILSPTGPYFRTGARAIRLLAVGEHVRSWPGGTAGYKLGMNYPACFSPQQEAAKKGYHQVLWLLGDGNRDFLDMKVTEAGSMNFFAVLKREDGNGACIYI